MNTIRLTKLSTTCAALGFAIGIVALAGSVPVRAAEDGSIDQQIYNGIMEGLGFKKDGAPTINYQERAPLVIPPSRDLPAPEKTGAITANNPSWPKDPDIERRKAQAAAEKDRNISDEREREQNPLRPDQLTPGSRGKKTRAARDDGYQAPASGFGSQLSPSELGTKTGFFGLFGGSKQETTKFTGEPPRALLTDPPVGYQTPSPDQPYGMGKAVAPKATNDYLTRGELSK
ncbi:MAG TPA: hypothetical protein VEJ43_02670 [Pseudolabrys sp.]|nr:hypothetical protein [Pseudolabrys sp.]